jgi:lipopolysaccharide/colanic/teichoic acid biosynthesis glycosyltransferase
LAHASSGVHVAAVRAIPRGSVCPESLASTADAISQAARAAGAREVVYCDARLGVGEAAFLAEKLLAAGFTIRIVSRRLVRLAGRMPLEVERWRGMPVVEFRAPRASRMAACVKRLLDCLVSVAALAACLPLWATLAPVALVLQGRGLLHRQMRVNRDGRLFEFYKIRTMSPREPRSTREAAEKVRGPLSKCARDPRITPLGKRLRRFSIDETPQFVNVLIGDISLVGARPPLPDEVAHYAPWQRCRLDGWMGITGLWQTCGRSDLGFGEMVFLDLLYNCNWSLSLDLRILWRTVGAVVSARGAY